MNYYIKVLKQYADFEGRARRSEYWYFTLISLIIGVALTFVGVSMNFPHLGDIYSVGVLLPNIAVAIRRMHDVDKSGWYCIIPFYNLILCFTEGTKGSNAYGPDPKDPNSTFVVGGDSGLLDDAI
jgi:uncharacterized membrane protein YhaH (DUF805 family)